MLRQTHDPSQAEPEIERIVLLKALKFGAGLAVIFLLFNFFFLMMTSWLGVALSVTGGILCALMRIPVIRQTYRKLEENPPTFPGERIIMEGYATHQRSFEGACHGYLCLTDRKLHFRYYPFEEKLADSIKLREVDRIETYNYCWVWPVGIRLIMRDGKRQKFTVQQWRSGWLEEIMRAWLKAVHRNEATISPEEHQRLQEQEKWQEEVAADKQDSSSGDDCGL